jgi:hypothetical protein
MRRREAVLRNREWKRSAQFHGLPYPSLRVEPAEGDPGLVAEIQSLAKAYDLSIEECREGMPLDCYQALRRDGFDGLNRLLRRLVWDGHLTPGEVEGIVFQELMQVLVGPGNWLFARLSPRYKRGDLLRYFYRVDFDGEDFVVRFDTLRKSVTNGGTVYLPPTPHHVKIAGHRWEIAFHDHAIERICQRMMATPEPTYLQYLTLWFEVNNNAWGYEPVELNDGQQALRMLTHLTTAADHSMWHEVYVKQILAADRVIPVNAPVSVVLGYLPIAVSGRYARAITFLYPGYKNTPEKRLLDALPYGNADRRRLLALTDHANYNRLFFGDGVEAIRWFHQNGIPQVRVDESGTIGSGVDSTR